MWPKIFREICQICNVTTRCPACTQSGCWSSIPTVTCRLHVPLPSFCGGIPHPVLYDNKVFGHSGCQCNQDPVLCHQFCKTDLNCVFWASHLVRSLLISYSNLKQWLAAREWYTHICKKVWIKSYKHMPTMTDFEDMQHTDSTSDFRLKQSCKWRKQLCNTHWNATHFVCHCLSHLKSHRLTQLITSPWVSKLLPSFLDQFHASMWPVSLPRCRLHQHGV